MMEKRENISVQAGQPLVRPVEKLTGRVHYDHCPVCDSREIHPLLNVKDEMVSGENFVIWQCGRCQLRFTQDAPAQDEIGHYYNSEDYISHTDTSKGLVNKLYQKVRKYTIAQKVRLIRSSTGMHKGNILDIGCGTGRFLHEMQLAGWNVKGIEPDPKARAVARKQYHLELSDPSAFDEMNRASYDAITLWHVLEHVHDLHDYIDHLKKLLRPNGKIFIAVPNYTSVDAGIYGLSWAAYDVPRHLYHFTPQSIKTLASIHGLKISATWPMWFDSFYISLLSSKYRNGKTNWPGALMSGIRSNLAALTNRNKCSSLIYVVEKLKAETDLV